MSAASVTLQAMSVGSSLYEVLGVPSDASRDELAAARRRLAIQWHPDRNPEDPDRATRHLQTINAAYDVLADPARRRRYDAERGRSEEAGFEFVCGDITVVAAGDRLRSERGTRSAEFPRSSITRVLVRRHAFSPGWATLVIVTTNKRHQLRLPHDAAQALATALLRR
jgi:curved DNA-binding protein CbpA